MFPLFILLIGAITFIIIIYVIFVILKTPERGRLGFLINNNYSIQFIFTDNDGNIKYTLEPKEAELFREIETIVDNKITEIYIKSDKSKKYLTYLRDSSDSGSYKFLNKDSNKIQNIVDFPGYYYYPEIYKLGLTNVFTFSIYDYQKYIGNI